MAFQVGTLFAKAGLDIDTGSFGKLKTEVEGAGTALGKLSNESKLAVAATAASVPAAVGAIAAAGVSTAASFEDATSTLTTLYGNVDTAKEKFLDLSQFAASTPFEFPELLDASVKLKSYGIEAGDYLGVLGDTASAMNKTLDDSVEALADAQTGEFERLKEFGIKALEITKSNADQLGVSAEQAGKTALMYTDKYGKQQVAVIDRNNRDMITKTVTGIWNDKYAGAMEARSKTLNGMISTLKDNLNMGLADLMGFNQGLDDFGISAFSVAGMLKVLVGGATEVTNVLTGLPEPIQAGIVAMVGMVAAISGYIAVSTAWSSAAGMVKAAMLAMNITMAGTLAPIAAIVIGIGALVAILYVIEERTGAVSYAFQLFKDIATIAIYGTINMFKYFYGIISGIFDTVKQKVLDMIPQSWISTIESIVNRAIQVFQKLGIDIHARAESVKGDNQGIATSTQQMGTQVGTTQQQVSGSTGLMGQAFDTLGISAGSMSSTVGQSGTNIQQTFSNTGMSAQSMGAQVSTASGIFQANMGQMGVSAGQMGLSTAAAGTQSVNALNGISSTAATAGGQVAASCNTMYAGFVQTSTGADMAGGAIIGVTPSVNSLTGATQSGTSANQSYAASFLDVSKMANDAASAAINAASRIGSAIKTSASQVGNIEALAGKWNTRAKLGTTSSGGKGTGEGNVKIIAAKTTNNVKVSV